MQIPIFPLNGAVLYPETNLPLNIFEDRYIEMVDFALSNKRLIGMIQTDEKGKLFKVGCVGKITSFNETEDGRYVIVLNGICRFKIISEEKNDKIYRIFNISFTEYLEDLSVSWKLFLSYFLVDQSFGLSHKFFKENSLNEAKTI